MTLALYAQPHVHPRRLFHTALAPLDLPALPHPNPSTPTCARVSTLSQNSVRPMRTASAAGARWWKASRRGAEWLCALTALLHRSWGVGECRLRGQGSGC